MIAAWVIFNSASEICLVETTTAIRVDGIAAAFGIEPVPKDWPAPCFDPEEMARRALLRRNKE